MVVFSIKRWASYSYSTSSCIMGSVWSASLLLVVVLSCCVFSCSPRGALAVLFLGLAPWCPRADRLGLEWVLSSAKSRCRSFHGQSSKVSHCSPFLFFLFSFVWFRASFLLLVSPLFLFFCAVVMFRCLFRPSVVLRVFLLFWWSVVLVAAHCFRPLLISFPVKVVFLVALVYPALFWWGG